MTHTFAVRLVTTHRQPDPVTGRRPVHARWVKIEADSGDEAAKKALQSVIAETAVVQVRGVTMWDPEIHEKKPDVASAETPSPAENQNAAYHVKHVGGGRWGVFDSQGIRQNSKEQMDKDTATMLAEALNGRAAVVAA